MLRLIENIEFRRVSDQFQDTLKKDKTRNLYEMSTEQYSKLLRENVTKHYKSSQDGAYNIINKNAQDIACRLKVADRMDTMAKSEAFLTLKDHKENFANNLPCRLINPAKSEVGIVSKKLLANIVGNLRNKTGVNLWQNTGAVIEWFQGIQEKSSHTFVSFDIVEFYPSISEKLLTDAISFARKHITIPESDVEVIFHARKSLLFENGKQWTKREKESLFDVTMGSYDGAEVCELVGTFMLNNLAECFERTTMGLYRDDGLAVLKDTSGHGAEASKKRIIQIFKDHGLKITIDANLKVVNYLDVTFDLGSGKYCPYRKPNDRPLYIHRLSNHPPVILKNLPSAISRRVSDISCDQQTFKEAAPFYEEALTASGFNDRLDFTEPTQLTAAGRIKRRRGRTIIWFNPPFSRNVATNIGRRFLQLVVKHFPKQARLNKIFNKNTLKVSYCCMPNMASVITSHNRKLRTPQGNDLECNCRAKNKCPMEGKCQSSSIVYKATVSSGDDDAVKEYIGLTQPPFKQRYANHMSSFRHEKYKNSTELAKHIWDLKGHGKNYEITWSIETRARAYSNESKRCNLCLSEKLKIITADKTTRLNKRPELVSQCMHASKFRLLNFAVT